MFKNLTFSHGFTTSSPLPISIIRLIVKQCTNTYLQLLTVTL
jgi:hypothetical protein